MITDSHTGRRREILDAALRCFTAFGYSRTSIDDVVQESGASVGSVYHHFGGKEQLAAALYVEALADYQEGFLRELGRERASAEEAVRGLVRYHLGWVRRKRDLARYLITHREADVAAATAGVVDGMNREVFAAARRWLERWADELRPLPLGLFYAVVIAPSQEFAREWLSGRHRRAISYNEAERILADAAWKAVRR